MQTMHMPEELQDRVVTYFDHLWQFQRTSQLDADQLFAPLSPALRLDMRIALIRSMVLKMTFLAGISTLA